MLGPDDWVGNVKFAEGSKKLLCRAQLLGDGDISEHFPGNPQREVVPDTNL
ncbi:hypothetical protein [Acetobacterium wieringae]|uniref:hypothetical protein n=1 Tax=Acetobacterium wieringae TaxID=52694 RepID=UPI002B209A1D|nr:hypothetical protein [Acetobacterium wieringae]MEA4807399.1 hypothetical protein [Acetobacterium wieringae]